MAAAGIAVEVVVGTVDFAAAVDIVVVADVGKVKAGVGIVGVPG